MRTGVRTALGATAGAAMLMLLDRRGAAAVARARQALSRKRVPDKAVEAGAHEALDRLTPHAGAIHLSEEHGCVVLTGDVLTAERARLVRAVAAVEGVDSVVDVMTEHRQPDGIAVLAAKGPRLPAVPRAQGLAHRGHPLVRLAAAGGGLGLTMAALRGRGASGLFGAIAGGALLSAGIAGTGGIERLADVARLRRRIELEESMIVLSPVEDVFVLFRALDNVPRFLRHVRSVERRGARVYRWSVDGGDGSRVSWDAEITSVLYNRRIAWRSVPGSKVRTTGEARFERLAPERTRVDLRLSYVLPFGRDGRALRAAFGEDPREQFVEDLCRLEALVEEGPPVSYSSPLSA